jgi:hypothetical protein
MYGCDGVTKKSESVGFGFFIAISVGYRIRIGFDIVQLTTVTKE